MLKLARSCSCVVMAMLTVFSLFNALPAPGQSIAPGTGRHTRRDKATVAAKQLAKSADEATAAQAAASAATTPATRAKAVSRAQTANQHIRTAAARASAIDPDAAVNVISSTTNVDTAITSNPSNSPAQANATGSAVGNAAQAATAASALIAATGSDPDSNLNWFLPTTLKKGGGFVGSNSSLTNAYFNANGPLAFVTKVKYTYNSSSNINALSSDLVAMQFPYLGFQLALGGNGTSNPASNTSTSPTGSTMSTTPTAASLQQAVQKLTQGGEFYILHPLELFRSKHSQRRC
jgi:hypothetical protein